MWNPQFDLRRNPESRKRETFLERGPRMPLPPPLMPIREAKSKIEVPALEPTHSKLCVTMSAKWLPSPARDKWLSILQPIAELPKKFAGSRDQSPRVVK